MFTLLVILNYTSKSLINLLLCLLVSYMQEHIEGYLELSAKTKTYFATAVSMWDAEFYIKVDDDVHVNLGKETFYLVLHCIL